MKKWLRRGMIAAVLVGIAAAVFYEIETHAVRGWCNGEATFQGRPTSYWAARIDSWVARFESPEEAEKYMRAHSIDGMLSSTAIFYKEPKPTFENSVRGWLGLTKVRETDPPEVLEWMVLSEIDPEPEPREPVLRELEAQPRFSRFVELSRPKKFVW